MGAARMTAQERICEPDELAALSRLRRSAAVAAVLAVLFVTFFQASKHLPGIGAINPAADDPYDAIGSFAVQAALLLAGVSLARVWWPRQPGMSSPRVCGLVRMQLTVVSAVIVTLVSDAIALARHVDEWFRHQAGLDLASAIVVMGVIAVAAGWYVLRAGRGCALWPSPGQLLRGFTSLIVVGVALWFYPESVRQSVFGELATVIMGAVLLFVPMAELSLAFVPYSTHRYAEVLIIPEWLQHERNQWVLILSAGLVAGGFIAVAEAMAVGGGSLRVSAIAVYLGVEVAGAAIGFAMLRGPLGLRYP